MKPQQSNSFWIAIAAGVALTLAGQRSVAHEQGQSGAQPTAGAGQAHRVLQPSAMQWGPAPAGLPAGGQATVLSGDPTQAGLFIVRIKTPAGYRIAPHWHSTAENLTVISGALNVGSGDSFDQSKSQAIGPGGFATMPAGMHHFAWTSEPTVLQVSGMGPFDIHYINPADDPRQQPAPTGRSDP